MSKEICNICEFWEWTTNRGYAIILLVTPPIHYIVFATPISNKNTFSKRDSRSVTVPFTCVKEEREVFLRSCGLPGITTKIDGERWILDKFFVYKLGNIY